MPDQQQSFLNFLLSPVTQSVTSSLPTKQEAVQAYLGAIVAFWVIGGITLWLVQSQSLGRKR